MNISGKHVPAYLILIIVTLAGIMGALVAVAAVTMSQPRSVTTINGEVFTVTGDLAVSGFSTQISTADATALGTSGDPVAMTAGVATANTAITIGHFTYSVTVAVVNVHDSVPYAVTLLQAGSPVGVVYIAQGANAVAGDSVTITWDLGTTLNSAVYEVNIVPT